MLVIRMQRTGRKGHAQFRVIVQDSRRTPQSGKVVAFLGSYDPHSKTTTLDKEKAQFYLNHGAQPSDRAARLLQSEGVKMPKWVSLAEGKQRTVRNPDKRRSTAPAPEAIEEATPATETAEDPAAEETAEAAETPVTDEALAAEAETTEEASAETETAEEAAPETPDTPAE